MLSVNATIAIKPHEYLKVLETLSVNWWPQISSNGKRELYDYSIIRRHREPHTTKRFAELLRASVLRTE